MKNKNTNVEKIEASKYKQDNIGIIQGKERFIVKEVLSKRVRKGHIEYLIEWHEATPKETCWVPFQILREALDSIGQYEYKQGQLKYRQELVTQLQEEIVAPMIKQLSEVKVQKPAMKVGGPRFGPRRKKIPTIEIKSDASLDIDVQQDMIKPIKMIKTKYQEEDPDKPQLRSETKIIKCLKNNTEKQLYFMVQYKGTFSDEFRGYTDLISASKLMIKEPQKLAEYLLEHFLDE